jgi:hypothetical protein
MPGLVPGIHVFIKSTNEKAWIARTKPGHDEIKIVYTAYPGEFRAMLPNASSSFSRQA